MSRHASSVLVACAVALAGCGCADEPAKPTGPVNVVLISLDSVRRDLLSCYGRKPARAPGVATSPSLDRLASRGVLMEDAYATTSWTLSSHMSLFTGEPELVHAVDLSWQRADPALPMLAEILQHQGYATAGFFSGPYLEPSFGFGRGFDRYEACYGPELAAASRDAEAAHVRAERARASGDAAENQAASAADDAVRQRLEDLSHRDVSSEHVSDAAIAELERRAGERKPFFLFAHYFDPHYDYVPPEGWDRFDPGYAGDVDATDFYTSPKIATRGPDGGCRRVVSDRDLEHVLALYEGELAWTDAQVGRVLDRLDALGLAASTLVIVTSDHGDEFFEHGAIGHRRTLCEEVVQVPLILRLPGVLPPGRRVRGLVSSVDVLATALELCGLQPQPGSSSRSFLALVRGDEERGERSVLGRLVMTYPVTFDAPAESGLERLPAERVFVTETFREGAIKVTRTRNWPVARVSVDPEFDERLEKESARLREAEELFWIDLAKSPAERDQDRSKDFSDARARAALAAFRARYAELVARRREARVASRVTAVASALKGLGYTDGAEGGIDLLLPPPGER